MDDRTKELADGCEEVDKSERVRGSRARVDKQLVRKQTLRQRIREALSAFPDDKSINTTDPGCAIMRSPRGSHAS